MQKAPLQVSYSRDSAIASSSFHNMICQEKVNLEQSGPKTLGVQRCKQVCAWWSLFNELFLFVQCTALTSKPLLFSLRKSSHHYKTQKFPLLESIHVQKEFIAAGLWLILYLNKFCIIFDLKKILWQISSRYLPLIFF